MGQRTKGNRFLNVAMARKVRLAVFECRCRNTWYVRSQFLGGTFRYPALLKSFECRISRNLL